LSTTSKIAYREQSKSVICEVSIESDELTQEELLVQSKKLYTEAHKFSANEALKKV